MRLRIQKIRKIILSAWGILHIGAYYRRLIVSRELKKYTFTDVLDAGCGTGMYSEYINKKFPSARILAVDISDHGCASNDKVMFAKEDLSNLSYNDRFDLALNIDVLEHLEDYSTVLAKFHQALRSNGILIIHAPNKIQRRFMRRFDHWHASDHKRTGFLLEELTAELKANGFEIKTARYDFGLLANIAWEFDRITDCCKVIKLVIFPILKLLAYCDSLMYHNGGNGLFIVSRKP